MKRTAGADVTRTLLDRDGGCRRWGSRHGNWRPSQESRAEGDPLYRRAYHLVQKLNYLAGARDAKFSA